MRKKIVLLVLVVFAGGMAAAQSVLPGYNGFWDRNTKVGVLDILEYYPGRLAYLRNEIYARYGRPFVNQVYQAYFNRQSWYRVQSNYTDAWLSEADKYNAELLRAIEQAPPVADTLAALERNFSSYDSSEYSLAFDGATVIEVEVDEYYSIYGYNHGTTKSYIVIGDWVVVYGGIYGIDDGVVHAYLLDHGTRKITAHAERYVEDSVINPLIRAQNRPARIPR
jgi:hypothetical protein